MTTIQTNDRFLSSPHVIPGKWRDELGLTVVRWRRFDGVVYMTQTKSLEVILGISSEENGRWEDKGN